MQNAPEAPHATHLVYLQTVAQYLGTGVIAVCIKELFDRWRNRQQAEQQAPLNEAQARSLDSVSLRDANKRMQELMEVIYELNSDVAAERVRADRAEMERDWRDMDIEHLQLEVARYKDEANAAHLFTEQLNNAAKLKGVHLSDFTPAQLNPAPEDKKEGPSRDGP